MRKLLSCAVCAPSIALGKNFTTYIVLLLLCLSLTACSGGSSDSGMLIEGSLTEAGGASHKSISLKHSDGQGIENVAICALGECSTTDGEGQWGFVAGESFKGGEVLFTINGHEIETTSVVNIPNGAKEVFLHFQHVEGGKVEVHHITVDGETSHNEEEGHGDEEESHAHQ